MFTVSSSRTMASAKPKFREPDTTVRDLVRLRAEAKVERKRAAEQQYKERADRIGLLMKEAAQARMEIATQKAARQEAEVMAVLSKIVPHSEIQRIMRRSCRVFKVLPAHLKSNCRGKQIVLARQFVCYWAARRTSLSLPQIGRQIGNRDHTTILHGARTYPIKRAKQGRSLRKAR